MPLLRTRVNKVNKKGRGYKTPAPLSAKRPLPAVGAYGPPAFASEKQRRFHPTYQSFGRRCTGSSAYGGVYEP